MQTGSIFPSTPAFLSQLQELEREGEACLPTFVSLAKRMEMAAGGKDQQPRPAVRNEEVLTTILERVAFYPLKPSVMQEELVRLGLSAALAASLSLAWASLAKSLVTARRRVDCSLGRLQTRLVSRVPGGGQEISLALALEGGDLALRLTPKQLFGLYETLEQVQAAIDAICQ